MEKNTQSWETEQVAEQSGFTHFVIWGDKDKWLGVKGFESEEDAFIFSNAPSMQSQVRVFITENIFERYLQETMSLVTNK